MQEVRSHNSVTMLLPCNNPVTLGRLHASVSAFNKRIMIQILFCGRHTPAARHVISLSVIAAVALSLLGVSRAQEPVASVKWVAPAAPAQKTNPVAANPASIEAGRKIYM